MPTGNRETSEIRLAPVRKPTTQASTTPQKQTTSGETVAIKTTTPISSSTTTKIAVLTTPKEQPKRPLIVEQEVKTTSVEPKKLDPPKDNERTTRSYSSSSSATSKPPKKQTKNEPKVEKVKATHRTESYPKSFPWYAVTIVGFIFSLIIFGIVLLIIRKIRQQKASAAHNDSLPNTSLDSSRISEAFPNEVGRQTADPLLTRND
jgi:cobalamin biosynthesis Mg chelatase CobN